MLFAFETFMKNIDLHLSYYKKLNLSSKSSSILFPTIVPCAGDLLSFDSSFSWNATLPMRKNAFHVTDFYCLFASIWVHSWFTITSSEIAHDPFGDLMQKLPRMCCKHSSAVMTFFFPRLRISSLMLRFRRPRLYSDSSLKRG